MNIGLIGLDTSHVSHFTQLLNDASDPRHIPGCKVVAAWRGGSQRMPHSHSRVDQYAAELEGRGVKLVAEISDLLDLCDAFFIESIDAGQHPEQLQAVVAAGKPVFVDKPFALSLADAEAMFALARAHNTPIFSSSALRYAQAFREALEVAQAKGPVIGCDFYGPVLFTEGGTGYFWYGIHTAEMLFSAMGGGFQRVSVVHEKDFDLLSVVWSDGRIGTIRGGRVPHYIFGGTIHTPAGPVPFEVPEDCSFYADLLVHVVAFLKEGRSPITEEETLGVIAMLEAAEAQRQAAS